MNQDVQDVLGSIISHDDLEQLLFIGTKTNQSILFGAVAPTVRDAVSMMRHQVANLANGYNVPAGMVIMSLANDEDLNDLCDLVTLQIAEQDAKDKAEPEPVPYDPAAKFGGQDTIEEAKGER